MLTPAGTAFRDPVGDTHVYVHRWTAESLKSLMPKQTPKQTYKGCCLRAAQYLKLRPVPHLRQLVADLTESTRLFIACHAFDEAVSSATQLILTLQPAAKPPSGRRSRTKSPVASRPSMTGQEADGLQALGLSGEALARRRLALELHEQKVAREPGRADYLRYLAKSLARTRSADYLQRALDILLGLHRNGRLSKADEPLIAAVEQLLQRARPAGA